MSTNNRQSASDISNPIWIIQSDKDVHFTTAIGVNAMETESLNVLVGTTRPRLPAFSVLILNIAMITTDFLPWRVILWRNTTFQNADYDLDAYQGAIRLHTTMAFQIGGAGQWYYDAHGTLASIGAPDGLTMPFPIPYRSDDGFIHVGLQNLGGAPKTAGANVSLRFLLQPMGN